jgi:hypothetical protein
MPPWPYTGNLTRREAVEEPKLILVMILVALIYRLLRWLIEDR